MQENYQETKQERIKKLEEVEKTICMKVAWNKATTYEEE